MFALTNRCRKLREFSTAVVVTMLLGMIATATPLTASARGASSPKQSPFLGHDVDATWDTTLARGKTYDVDYWTESGTWMGVDISPDGKWLVFDHLGQVYRMPSVGGEAICLTQNSGIALNFHPRFSPDGRRIAFVSDRKGQENLWVMNADGSNPQPVMLDPVTRVMGPKWTPDGQAIVATRAFPTNGFQRSSERIWLFPVDGKVDAPRELTGSPFGYQTSWASLSPDGSRLYFQYSTYSNPGSGHQYQQHIRQLDLRSGEMAQITKQDVPRHYRVEGPFELAPEVSPDGRWLAFVSAIPGGMLEYRGHQLRGRSALWLRNLDTGDDRILMDPIDFAANQAHSTKNILDVAPYSWSKDSKSLVLSQGGKIRRVWLDGERVDTIPMRVHVHRTVSEKIRANVEVPDEPMGVRFIRWPTATPDGSVFVFDAIGWLWRLEADSHRPKRLVPDDDGAFQFMPSISPDGKQVAFVSWNDHELGHVWRVSIDGGKPTRVTTRSAQYAFPTWSEDSAAIYAVRTANASAEHIAGGEAVRYERVQIDARRGGERVIQEAVTEAPMSVVAGRIFHVEPHGFHYAATNFDVGKPMPEAYSVLVSTDPTKPKADRREHLRFPFADQVVPSPDGQWVAYAEDNNIQLTRFHRPEAVYQPDNPKVWDVPELVQINKENPHDKVRKLSEAGGIYPRWRDSNTLIFSNANTIYIHDVSRNQTRSVAVDLQIPRPIPPGKVAFKNTRIVTLNKRQVIESGTVIVDGARISCVGECDTSAVDRVIDATGKTIIPGFVDPHAHAFADDVPNTTQYHGGAARYLAYGVTTALDPSARNDSVFPTAELIAAGRIVGTRVFSTGQTLMPLAPESGPNNYQEAENTIKRLALHGAVSIKIYMTPRRDQRQMYAEAARKFGLSVTNEREHLFHSVGTQLDGDTGNEHYLPQLVVFDDAIRFFAKTDTVYSPTLFVAGMNQWEEEYWQPRIDRWNDPKMRRFWPWRQNVLRMNFAVQPKTEFTFPFMAEYVKDHVRAGGHAAIGGHGEDVGMDSQWDLWGLSEALEPMEALEVASQGGAYMIGLEDDVGSVEIGKLADLLVLDGNPLEDIRNTAKIDFVMKGGVLYEGGTLNEVWPKQRSFNPPWQLEQIYRNDVRSVDYWDR